MAANPYEKLVDKNPYESMAGVESQEPTDADAYFKAQFQDAMSRGFGTGAAPFFYEIGGKVTDLTGSPVAGGLSNFFLNAIPAFLTAGRLQGAPTTSLAEGPAKKLLQTAVKPSVGDLKSGAADRALKTMLEENIYPTASGMEKASKVAGKLEDAVEKAISSSTKNVSVASIGSRLKDTHQKALMQVNPQPDIDAVRAAWDSFKNSPLIKGKTEIPVRLAHELKKGTYRSLAGKYGEVGSTATEAQKALARGAREEVANAVPEIVDLLKREASLMNVKDVAASRAWMASNNDPLGLSALRLDHPLSAISFWADRWPAFKAFLAMQLHAGAKPQLLAPLGIEAGMLSDEARKGILSGALVK